MKSVKSVIFTLTNMILPSLMFYAAYKIWGIIPAIAISTLYSIISIIVSAIRDKVKNSQVIGLLSLAGSAVAIYFTGEEKYYYVPSLIVNIVFLGFMIYLCARKKSIFHFILKDFEIDSLKRIPEDRLMNVNTIWLVFFALKIISKVVGILCLNFRQLFWLVFILGDPMTIVAVVMSVALIRRSFMLEKKNDDTENP